MRRPRVFADGLCAPSNPGGWACWAWVALQEDREMAKQYGCLGYGPGMTSNVAEYHAVLHALQWLATQGGHGAQVCTGSLLVVNQVPGRWKRRKASLFPLCAEARALVAATDTHLVWVPRAQNRLADALTRRAFLEATGHLAPERSVGREQHHARVVV